MYVSSSSFMYLRISCYCDACLNSSDLRVGVTTLFNTMIQLAMSRSRRVPVTLTLVAVLPTWRCSVLERFFCCGKCLATCGRFVYRARLFESGPGSGLSLSKCFGPILGLHANDGQAIELTNSWLKMINCELFSRVYFAALPIPAVAHILTYSVNLFLTKGCSFASCHNLI